MMTKEKFINEIENLPDAELQELHFLIGQMIQQKTMNDVRFSGIENRIRVVSKNPIEIFRGRGLGGSVERLLIERVQDRNLE